MRNHTDDFVDKSSSAVVVFSGGQDSTTCLFWAKRAFGSVTAITFDYGQRHAREIDAARTICKMADVQHETIYLGPNVLKGMSPLTDHSKPLETYTDYASMDKIIGDRIELTFVPMRNPLFLTIAANRAAVQGANYLVTGVCQQDGTNYPDCREGFISSMERMVKAALEKEGFIIATPLMHLNKASTVRLASRLPGCWEALAYSHTAYDGQYPPTGKDHASILRAYGFEQAGMPDPLVVRAWREGLMELPGTSNFDTLRTRPKSPEAALLQDINGGN